MNLTYQERQELNTLSEKAFGTASRWKKLLENGYYETWARDRQAMVTGPDGKMDKRTFTERKQVAKYPTLEEIRKFMADEIEKKNAIEALMKLEADKKSGENTETTPSSVTMGSTTTFPEGAIVTLSGTDGADEAAKVTLGNE